MRQPFEPLLERCAVVPFGDAAALERELAAGDVAAFIVEPVQIEGGLRFAPPGYLRRGPRPVLASRRAVRPRRNSDRVWAARIAVRVSAGRDRARRARPREVRGRIDCRHRHHDDDRDACSAGHTDRCAASICTVRRSRATRSRASPPPRRCGFSRTSGSCENARARGDELVAGLRARLRGHPLVRDIRGRGLLVAIELTAGVETARRDAGRPVAERRAARARRHRAAGIAGMERPPASSRR